MKETTYHQTNEMVKNQVKTSSEKTTTTTKQLTDADVIIQSKCVFY